MKAFLRSSSEYSPFPPIRIFFILRVSLEFWTYSLFFYVFLVNWYKKFLILIKDIPSLPLQKNILIGGDGLYLDSRSPLPAPPVLASGAPKQSEKLHLHHVLGE